MLPSVYMSKLLDWFSISYVHTLKGNSKEWFDSVISEGKNNRDKLLNKSKKSGLQLYQENYKKALIEVKKLFAGKKRNYFKMEFTEKIGKPKEQWNTIKAVLYKNGN